MWNGDPLCSTLFSICSKDFIGDRHWCSDKLLGVNYLLFGDNIVLMASSEIMIQSIQNISEHINGEKIEALFSIKRIVVSYIKINMRNTIIILFVCLLFHNDQHMQLSEHNTRWAHFKNCIDTLAQSCKRALEALIPKNILVDLSLTNFYTLYNSCICLFSCTVVRCGAQNKTFQR